MGLMSALPLKADMCSAPAHVCFGPIADIEDISDELRGAWQNNPDFGELARLCIDFDRTSVLLDDYVVADRQAKAGAFPRRLGREEWLKHLFLHVGRNTGAVIADPNFHTITKAFGRSRESGFVV